jgi:cytochrome b subunit of formate dehydrogenase
MGCGFFGLWQRAAAFASSYVIVKKAAACCRNPKRMRRFLRVGIVACLSVSFLPNWSSGQSSVKESSQRCLNCHGQEHIATISLKERATMVVAPESGLKERENPANLFIDRNKISRSVHDTLTCNECHVDVETLPHPDRLPRPQCKSCHQEEAEKVSRSRHAEVLQRSEPPAPYCWDCHGTHEILSQGEVNPLDKIRICASCHQTHSGQIEGVENGELLVRSYLDSVHGQDRGEPGSPSVGATCEDCHGHHEVLPIKDPRSRVNRRNISGTCGSCHPEIHEEFEATVHADVAHRNDPSMRPAVCNNCHTTHVITHAGTPEFMRDLVGECGSCHENLYRTYQDTFHGQVQTLGGTRAARCSDCHGTHNIRRPEDPASTLSAANRPETCGRCHQEINSLSESARQNFVAFRPHADFRDKTKNTELFLIWCVAIVVSIALLILWGLHWIGWLKRTSKQKQHLSQDGTPIAMLRFKPLQRWTHLAVMVCVSGLILTGLPLKFSREPLIADLTRHLVEVETLIFLHRLFAVFLGGIAVFHIVSLLTARRKSKQPLIKRIWGPDSLMPTLADMHHFAGMLRWFVKKGERPDLERWSYREKFDYWATVATLGVLAASGMILWFPAFFAEFFSGYWFNVAYIVHGSAGLLAMGSILLIHLLNASLRRGRFPFNDAMFTGQISESELKSERAAQYARLTATGTLERWKEPAVSGSRLKISTYATSASLLLGIGLIILIVIAIII